MRRLAHCIHAVTRQPLEPLWTPLLEEDELAPANQRLAALSIPWRFAWLPLNPPTSAP